MLGVFRAATECEVRLYGGIAREAGVERAMVSLEGDTLGELLAELGRRFPSLAPLLESGGPLVLVLNGRAVEPPEASLKLKSGDVLSIMPFVAGG
ncbi:MAG: MoaD/ThiS family protein [Thermoplasmatota archaeon]